MSSPNESPSAGFNIDPELGKEFDQKILETARRNGMRIQASDDPPPFPPNTELPPDDTPNSVPAKMSPDLKIYLALAVTAGAVLGSLISTFVKKQ